MISVVMATFNGEQFIEKQLISICEQTLKPDEVIIYDDCSTDNTRAIIDKMVEQRKDIHWKLNYNEKNKGYIINFFNAIGRAKGDIIVLSDQDDIWLPNKLLRIKEIMTEHPLVQSIHSDIDIIDKDDNVIVKSSLKYKNKLKKLTLRQFCKRLNYCGMSTAFRKEIKEDFLKLDVNMLYTHDWTIHALALIKDGLYVTNEVWSLRRYHEHNVALQLEDAKREGIPQRLSVVEGYLKYYLLFEQFLQQFSNKDDILKMEEIKKYIKVTRVRLAYLEQRSVWLYIKNIVGIRYYQSFKAFICDLLYLSKIF